MKNKLLLLLLAVTMTFPRLTFANGGDQRVSDGYVVNLSRSPFTPIAGIETALLASFVDLKTGNIIQDDLLVSIRIAEKGKSEYFIHEKNIPVKRGILEYSYTFQKPGMHEIFFDFIFANDPAKKVHALPDFLIDVQKPLHKKAAETKPFMSGLGMGATFGLLIGFVFGLKRGKQNSA